MGRTWSPFLVLLFVHAITSSPGVFFEDDQHYPSSSNGQTNPDYYQERSTTPESQQYTSHSDHTEENNEYRTEASSSLYIDTEHPAEYQQNMDEGSSSSTNKEWSDHNQDGDSYGSDHTAYASSPKNEYDSQLEQSTTMNAEDQTLQESSKNGDNAPSDTESFESQSTEHAEMAKIHPEKALGSTMQFDGDNTDIDDFDFGLEELYAEEDIDVQAKDILPSEWIIILTNYLEILGQKKETKKINYKIKKANELKDLTEELVMLDKNDFEDGDPKKLQCAKMDYDVLSHIHHLPIEDQKYIFDIDKDGIPDFEVVEVEEPMKKKHKKRKHKKGKENKTDQDQSPGTEINAESHDQDDGQQQNSYTKESENLNEIHDQNSAYNNDEHNAQQFAEGSDNGVQEVSESGQPDKPVYDVQVTPYTYTGEQQSWTDSQDGYQQNQRQQEEQYNR